MTLRGREGVKGMGEKEMGEGKGEREQKGGEKERKGEGGMEGGGRREERRGEKGREGGGEEGATLPCRQACLGAGSSIGSFPRNFHLSGSQGLEKRRFGGCSSAVWRSNRCRFVV